MGTARDFISNPVNAVMPGVGMFVGGDGAKGFMDRARGFVAGRPSTSGPVEIPGLYNRAEGAKYARKAVAAADDPLRHTRTFDNTFMQQNPYESMYRDRLQNPNFARTSDAERALVEQAYAGRQGTFNALGIGSSPAAQSAIAAAAAPTLAGLRQQDMDNTFRGSQQFDERRRGNLGALIENMGKELEARGLNINALLQAANFAIPQVATQNTGTRRGLLDFVNVSVGPEGISGSVGGK
jgi:hypothetical protein